MLLSTLLGFLFIFLQTVMRAYRHTWWSLNFQNLSQSKENKSKPNYKHQAQTFCWGLILNEYAYAVAGEAIKLGEIYEFTLPFLDYYRHTQPPGRV